MTPKERIAAQPTTEVDDYYRAKSTLTISDSIAFARLLVQQRNYLMEVLERVADAYRKETWRENNQSGVAIATPLLNEVSSALAAIREQKP